jgi:PAS domain-containing protein
MKARDVGRGRPIYHQEWSSGADSFSGSRTDRLADSKVLHGFDNMAHNQQADNETNKFLTIFESLHCPVAVLDHDNRIDTVNPAWADLFGQPQPPEAGHDAASREKPTVDWLGTEVDAFTSGGRSEQTIEKSADTSAGERCFTIQFKRMPSVREAYSGTVIMLNDVTHQKQAETALAQAQAAARNSERFQGALELAGAVCHDMNQPLMAINGYAELILMDCPDDSPFTDKLKKIAEQVAKMGDITQKLMRVTRYETKTYMDRQIIDIDKSSSED